MKFKTFLLVVFLTVSTSIWAVEPGNDESAIDQLSTSSSYNKGHLLNLRFGSPYQEALVQKAYKLPEEAAELLVGQEHVVSALGEIHWVHIA